MVKIRDKVAKNIALKRLDVSFSIISTFLWLKILKNIKIKSTSKYIISSKVNFTI